MSVRRLCKPASVLMFVVLLIPLCGCLSIDRDVSCVGAECVGGTVHVEVLRGISGYWPGVDRFQEQLAARGFSSTVSWCELYPVVANRLVEKKQMNPHTPIVVVGYSLGANHALRLCRRLEESGFCVDGLILLETTYEDTVPANVRYCYNVYKPRPLDEIPFMRGIPLDADNLGTLMVNYDCNAHDDGRYHGLNHLTLCHDDSVQALLADAVAGCLVPAYPAVETPPDPPGWATYSFAPESEEWTMPYAPTAE